MGCGSSRQEEPIPKRSIRDDRSRLSHVDGRTDRSSAFADGSQPSHVSRAQTIAEMRSSSVTLGGDAEPLFPEYMRFDPVTASAMQRGYFDALLLARPTADRKATLAEIAGILPEHAKLLSDFDVTSIAFESKRERNGARSLDAIFREAAGAVTNDAARHHLPGSAHADDEPVLPDLDADGIITLGQLLGGRSANDEVTLYFLHKLGCREGPWRLRYDQWQAGCATLCLLDAQDAKKGYDRCASEYASLTISHTAFFDFYRFLFDFVKAPSARCISADDAVTLWEATLVPRWAGGTAWCDYVRSSPAASAKGIFKDLWVQTIVFASTTTWPQCPEADADTSWPSLIDGFIDFCRHPTEQSPQAGKNTQDEASVSRV